jgi:hypothetical protein
VLTLKVTRVKYKTLFLVGVFPYPLWPSTPVNPNAGTLPPPRSYTGACFCSLFYHVLRSSTTYYCLLSSAACYSLFVLLLSVNISKCPQKEVGFWKILLFLRTLLLLLVLLVLSTKYMLILIINVLHSSLQQHFTLRSLGTWLYIIYINYFYYYSKNGIYIVTINHFLYRIE